MRRNLLGLTVMAAIVVMATSSFAAQINIATSGPNGSGGVAVTLDESIGDFQELEDGTFLWVGEESFGGWDVAWDIRLDPDPSISDTLVVTNNTGADGTFSFGASIPMTVGAVAGVAMDGASSIAVNDADIDGTSTLAAIGGGSIYTAKLAGVTQMTMFDDPFSLTPAFPPTTTSVDDDFSGFTSTAYSVGDLIELIHAVSLTEGDSATLTSNFVVVPEPASFTLLLLAGLGLLGAASARRRKA